MKDPLQDAVNALRETTSGEESGAARYTRSRILAELRQSKRRKTLNSVLALPLAAVLLGSVAWAAARESLPVAVQRLSVALGLREPPKPPQTAPPRATVQSTSPPPAVPPSVTPSQPRAPAATTKVAPVSAHDSPVTEEELALYEAAHRAHFTSRDYEAALVAWQTYLRQMPHGRFAQEANYNRALCLLRLARTKEARLALEPFAGGRYGNYRQAEARALLGKLDEAK